MKTLELGTTGEHVSALCLGCMIFGSRVDEASSFAMLDRYLEAGGFLHIDDNYGMDPYVRLAMKKVFPQKEWVEVPYSHPLYSVCYRFPNGLPASSCRPKPRPRWTLPS